MLGKPTRQWGDGATDKREHVIDFISYERDFLICRCGKRIRGVQDDVKWKAHRGPERKR